MTLLATSSTSNWLSALGRMFRAGPPGLRTVYEDRASMYSLWDAYYHNTVYERLGDGGQRDYINDLLGNAAAADLAGLYNPVAEVCDLYQHVFGGAFRPSDAKAEEDSETDIRAVPGKGANATALLPALDAIWQWSNLNTSKQLLQRIAPTHGNVGLRIVAEDHPDPARRRVYLKPEHPRIIRDVETDARGNVTAIELEWDYTYGLGDDQEVVTIREVMTKAEIATYRVDVSGRLVAYDLAKRTDGGPGASYPNRLGVVPYVLLAHQPSGELWGLNAFYRARPAIDRLNALITHINVQIHRTVRAKWFVAASGPAPVEFDLSDMTIAYTDTRGGTTPPVIEPMIAPLDIQSAIAEAQFLVSLIEDKLPELKAIGGRYLAGQSGETVAQLRLPAEYRLQLARPNYEDALVRAQQIALSWGILLDLWNLGTGMGSKDAADAAYRSGLEDHRFNERAFLPPVGAQAMPQAPQAAMPIVAAATPVEERQGTPETVEEDEEA
jgi:hypothetical protein